MRADTAKALAELLRRAAALLESDGDAPDVELAAVEDVRRLRRSRKAAAR